MIVRHVENFDYDKVPQTLVVHGCLLYINYGKEVSLGVSTTSPNWLGRLFGKRSITSYNLDQIVGMNFNAIYFEDVGYVMSKVGLFGIKRILSRLHGDGDKLVYNKVNHTLIEVGPDDTMNDIIKVLRGDDL